MTATQSTLRYDRNIATSMIPLLRVLVGEYLDRTRDIRSLRWQLAKVLDADGRLPESQPERNQASELQACLSIQLRESRHVAEELEGLACVFDPRRRMVRIPGANGSLEGGFEWYLGSRDVVSVGPNDLAST